jgi:hypothetical protein
MFGWEVFFQGYNPFKAHTTPPKSKEYMIFNEKKPPHLQPKHRLVVGSSGTHTLDNIGLRYF